MNFRHSLLIANLFAIYFAACSSQDHAGVLTETESGQTLAGIITNPSGSPLSKVAVYMVKIGFNAVQDSVLLKTESAEDGSFVLHSERIPTGTYTILFENEEEDSGAKASISLQNSDTLPFHQVLLPYSQIAISLSGFGLSENDTVCIPETFACQTISAEDVQNDIAVVSKIPAADYSQLLVFNGEAFSIPVLWNIDSGNVYAANSAEDDSAFSILNHLRFAKDSPTNLPDTTRDFEVFQNEKVAISFWVKLPEDAFDADSNVALFTAMQDSLGFVVRQNSSNQKKAIGVELFVKADSLVISDTTIYGSMKILDDAWHQIAVLLNGKHIAVMLDGEVIRDTDFKRENGFGNLTNFIIGDSRLKGTIDIFRLYDGEQDSLWMRTLYKMEKRNRI